MSVSTPEWAANNPEAQPVDFVIHTVLRKWADALQDGKAEYLQPDFNYSRQWTEAELEAFVTDLDEYVWRQASWVKNHYGIEADAGPGYARLAVAQRLAMMQELHTALEQFKEPEPIVLEPSSTIGDAADWVE